MKGAAVPPAIALRAHADRRDLVGAGVESRPDTGVALEASDLAEFALGVEGPHCRNDGVFELGDVQPTGRRVVLNGDDGPAHGLTRCVIRHVTTTIGRHDVSIE